jgi:hypothetical protein
MAVTLKWEKIDNSYERAKVFGGWILKVCDEVMHDRSEFGQGMVGGWDWRSSICFIPDPDHLWGKE